MVKRGIFRSTHMKQHPWSCQHKTNVLISLSGCGSLDVFFDDSEESLIHVEQEVIITNQLNLQIHSTLHINLFVLANCSQPPDKPKLVRYAMKLDLVSLACLAG